MRNKFTLKNLFAIIFFSIFTALTGSAQDTIKVNPSSPGMRISPDFTGMAYESDGLHFDSLRQTNHTLVNYFKTAGVKTFRLGGNSVENYRYNATASRKYPADTVTNSELDSLFGFAKAVGCKIILGIDFGGYFNATLASNEVSYVMAHYSNQMLAFEIGNEPNLYYRNNLRSLTYSYDSFQYQFLQYVDTIRKYTPTAPICGPSAARLQAAGYTNPFVHYMYLHPGIINLLTQHNYSIPLNIGHNGETIDSLLSQKTFDSISHLCDTLMKCADSDNVPFQMDEGNAMYPEGQWGVNNSMTGALWALDYMYTLAEAGVNGFNFHSTYNTPATVINDTLHVYSARPIYYGILAFQLNRTGKFLPYNFIGTAKNLSIHPVVDSVQNIYVTLINKDTLNSLSTQLYADSNLYTTGQWTSLAASSVSDTFGITLAGSQVTAGGLWTPQPWVPVTASHGCFPVTVPKASALIVKLNGPSLGIQQVKGESGKGKVYPNPNSGKFSIQMDNGQLTVKNDNTTVEIYNILGEKVFSQLSIIHYPLSIALTQPNGVYLYRISNENGNVISNGKFVIQK